MKVLMKIKTPNVWHGGGDAVWLLSPLHHQNVPQKLPAVIKPGIKLEQSLQTQIVSDKNHAESKIFPNQIVPGGCGRVRQRSTSAELSARPRYNQLFLSFLL